MNMRWVVAAGACLALALLTLNVSSETHFDRVDPAADAPPGPPATAACAANAKPANLNFTLKDVDGKDVKLASLKGKVVLLDFWATWCGPCKIEIPWFIEFQNKYGKAGLQVVGVSVDDTQAKLKPYVAQMKMNYPVLQGLDHDDLQDAYGRRHLDELPVCGHPGDDRDLARRQDVREARRALVERPVRGRDQVAAVV